MFLVRMVMIVIGISGALAPWFATDPVPPRRRWLILGGVWGLLWAGPPIFQLWVYGVMG